MILPSSYKKSCLQSMQRPPSSSTSVQCSYFNPVRKRRCGNWTRTPPNCYWHPLPAPSSPLSPSTPSVPSTTSTPPSSNPSSTAPPPPKKQQKQDTCPICLNITLIRPFMTCSHGVCHECLTHMRDFHCPICRSFIALSFSEKELDLLLQKKVDDLVSFRSSELGAQIVRAYEADLKVYQNRYEKELASLRKALEHQISTLRGLISENQNLKHEFKAYRLSHPTTMK